MVYRATLIMASALLLSGCAPAPVESPPESTAQMTTTATTTSAAPPSLSTAIREWEAIAGSHFRESAAALRRVNEATDSGDAAGVSSGCEALHDTNTIGLQGDLPTPDPELTAELQRMIDDMNSATHACLRFTLGRHHEDAANYQDYLGRAVEHLQRAKTILEADRVPR